MNEKLLKVLIQGLFAVLTPEVLKSFVDAGLDAIEDAVAESENKVDDRIVLPMCKLIRNTFGIDDNDPIPEENDQSPSLAEMTGEDTPVGQGPVFEGDPK